METYPPGAYRGDLSAERNDVANAAQTAAANGDAAGNTYAMRGFAAAVPRARASSRKNSRAPSTNSGVKYIEYMRVDDGVSDADPRVLQPQDGADDGGTPYATTV